MDVKLSAHLGDYLELNFPTAKGRADLLNDLDGYLEIRLPRNEVTSLLNENIRCTVEFSDHMLHSCMVKRVQAEKEWIVLTCLIDKTYTSASVERTAAGK
jgi:hypothetical protein